MGSLTPFIIRKNIIRTNMSRKMRLAEYIEHMGENWKAYMILVGSPEGKRPLGRQR
jgi:hypothetical protein